MSILETVQERYSVRSFTTETVSDEDLAYVLETGRWSQSAKNFQEWRFVVVRDSGMRQRLSVAARNQAFVAEAPVIVACCGLNVDYVMTCGQHAYVIDLAIAMENMCLAAHDRGLGVCWVGAFFEDQVKALLDIPADGVRIVGMLALGHPADKRPNKQRKSLDELVMKERWR